jgi:hypothetical protein
VVSDNSRALQSELEISQSVPALCLGLGGGLLSLTTSPASAVCFLFVRET